MIGRQRIATRAAIVWGLGSALLAASALNAQIELPRPRTVMLSGQTAPGTGFLFKVEPAPFNPGIKWQINERGFAAILSFLDGAPSTANLGLWTDRVTVGSLAPVVIEGDPVSVPGVPDATIAGGPGSDHVIGRSERVAIWTFLQGTGVTTDDDTALWLGDRADMQLVAREGDPIPNTSLSHGGFFHNLRINALDRISFADLVRGPGVAFPDNDALFFYDGIEVHLVAREGAPAPETAGDFTSLVGDVTGELLSFNDSDLLSFVGDYQEPGPVQKTGIWLGPSDALILMASTGSLAPGTVGETFVALRQPSLSAQGFISFVGTATDQVAGSREGIWRSGPAGLELVALGGQTAPGGGFFSIFDYPSIDDSRDIAFRAHFATNDIGIYVKRNALLSSIAREGDPAPGFAAGVVIDLLDTNPSINAAGKVAFTGRVTGNGPDRRAIWVWEPSGGSYEVLAAEGEVLHLSDFDQRLISQLMCCSLSGRRSSVGDGLGLHFNDLDQLVFFARFENGTSGVFVTGPLFRDGFESGDTSAWTGTVP